MKNRITSIDYAKGLAIICVVLGHVLYFCIYEQHTETSSLFSFIYSFHMPLFFFLSGLVVSVKAKSLWEAISDLKKRFLQLIMPMLLIGGVFCFVVGNDVIPHFLDTDMKLGYWYLMVLFLYYILVRFGEVVAFYINGGGVNANCLYSYYYCWFGNYC